MTDRLAELEATIRDGIILRPDNGSENPEADALDALAELVEIADAAEARAVRAEAALREIEHRVRTRRVGGPMMDGTQKYVHPLASEIAAILSGQEGKP